MEDSSMPTSFSTRFRLLPKATLIGFGLLLASLGAGAFAAYPMYVIYPFREQTPAALQRSLWVLLHSKPILLGIAVLITVVAVMLWRKAKLGSKLLLASATVIAILAAVISWINPYEHMFHPLGAPSYVTANQASVDPNDMVIAVTIGGESRAYPIREMGYHHVVNDRLHQLPIAVTY